MGIAKRNGGFTFVEILCAIAVIATAAMAITYFYISSLNLSDANKEETIAMTHLANMVEAIKSTPVFSNIIVDFPNGDRVDVTVVGNKYGTIVGGDILKNEHITVYYVNPTSDPLEITVGVSWQDKRGVSRTRYLVTKMTR